MIAPQGNVVWSWLLAPPPKERVNSQALDTSGQAFVR